MYWTRYSTVAAFSLLLLCRCFRTGAQPVGGVEGGNSFTSVAPVPGERAQVGDGGRASYAGRMERVNLTGGLSVEVFVPLVYAGPWLGPLGRFVVIQFIGIPTFALTMVAAFLGVGTCIAEDLQPKLVLVNDPNVELWYVLRGFGAAVFFLPWLTLAISCASTRRSFATLCLAGSAAAAQVCAEFRWRRGVLTGAQAWRSVLSKVETLDACTDGAVVVVARSINETARRRFVESFAGDTFAKHLAEHVGVGGLFLAVLLWGTAVQASMFYFHLQGAAERMVNGRGNAGQGINFCANACGLGALADAEETSAGKSASSLLSGISRTFAETVPQLLLQTALLMATKQSVLSQPLLGMSLLSSCGMLLVKTCEVARASWATSPRDVVQDVLFVLFVLLLGASSLVLWARIYYSEACASREWGLTTGCVELAE